MNPYARRRADGSLEPGRVKYAARDFVPNYGPLDTPPDVPTPPPQNPALIAEDPAEPARAVRVRDFIRSAHAQRNQGWEDYLRADAEAPGRLGELARAALQGDYAALLQWLDAGEDAARQAGTDWPGETQDELAGDFGHHRDWLEGRGDRPAPQRRPARYSRRAEPVRYAGRDRGAQERARKVDLITLPESLEGTSCGVCRYYQKGECLNPEVAQHVAPDMCCNRWDAPGTSRPLQGRTKKAKRARRVKKASPEVWNRARVRTSGMTHSEQSLLLQLEQSSDPNVATMASQALRGDSDALVMLHDAMIDAGYSERSQPVRDLREILAYSLRQYHPAYGGATRSPNIRRATMEELQQDDPDATFADADWRNITDYVAASRSPEAHAESTARQQQQQARPSPF